MRFGEVLRSTGGFDQEVLVTELPDRRPLFIERCAGRSVLHVAGRQKPSAASAEAGLRDAEALLRHGNAAAALSLIEATRARFPDARLLQAEVGLLLGTGQNLEGLRRAVAWLRDHPEDATCLLLCADAAEALGDRAMAEQWRAQAPKRR
jgi:predicted Zn-dependent protease